MTFSFVPDSRPYVRSNVNSRKSVTWSAVPFAPAFTFLDAPTHFYERPCPSVCQSVCLSITLSLKLRKTAQFREKRCSLRGRTSNQGSGSIHESRTQSITLSNHSYTSQGASLAHVGLVYILLVIKSLQDVYKCNSQCHGSDYTRRHSRYDDVMM